MNASKEEAGNALAVLAELKRKGGLAANLLPDGPAILADLDRVAEFVRVAQRKLPTEQSYAAEAKRRGKARPPAKAKG